MSHIVTRESLLKMLEVSSPDRKAKIVGRALRWDMAAMDAANDAGYYCFRWGISYSCESDIKIHMNG